MCSNNLIFHRSPSYFCNEPDRGYQYKHGQDYGQHSESNPNRGAEAYLNKIEELLTRPLEKDAQYQKKLVEHDAILRNQISVFAGLQDAVKEISEILKKVEEGSKQISQCMYESDSEFIRETEEESAQLEEQPAPGYKYDAEGNYLGYMNQLGELFPMFPEEGKEPIMEYIDDSEENIPDTETRVADKVPPQATQRSLVKKEEIEDDVNLGDSLELIFGVEEKVVNELSEEDESLDLELDGLSEYDEGGTLDVDGDIAFFEALLVEDSVDGDVVLEEEHHFRPVDCVLNDDQESKYLDKVEDDRLPENRSCVYFRRWFTGVKKPLKVKHDQSSRYLQRIRLLPGKFKYRWSNSLLILNSNLIFFGSTIDILLFGKFRVELNGLDRVQIKEKPPDLVQVWGGFL
ncbi:uncharacterized protein LOC143610366 [Bidens hawaiensis]|uniref:uncharacterized protein LOC143610366 n=1 Tax=Bidens hawaiensis TaxID=980011 RepID=UPI00404ACB8B